MKDNYCRLNNPNVLLTHQKDDLFDRVCQRMDSFGNDHHSNPLTPQQTSVMGFSLVSSRTECWWVEGTRKLRKYKCPLHHARMRWLWRHVYSLLDVFEINSTSYKESRSFQRILSQFWINEELFTKSKTDHFIVV